MTEFLSALLTFPTALFSIVMGVVMIYWLFVIIGAVGIDILDGDIDLHAGAKAASGMVGGAKAAGGVLEGGAKAANALLEGGKAVSGHGHGHDVGDGHGHGHADGEGVLDALGFAGIPATVSISMVAFIAWTISLLSAIPLHGAAGSLLPSWVISGGLGLVSFALGLVGGGLAVRPLRPVFVSNRAPGRDELMGRVCNISSGNVTNRFGHATFADGGAGLILNVVCVKANTLKRGDPALIIGYDAAHGAYEIEPVDWLLPEEMQQLQDPQKAAAVARARARN